MLCKVCNTNIDDFETSETCSQCGATVHTRCAQTKRVLTSRFYELLTGRSHIDKIICKDCNRRGK